MNRILILAILCCCLWYNSVQSKNQEIEFKKVRLPGFFKGFVLEKLLALKKKLGIVKWGKLKHLFLLNPHLPLLLLAGKPITQNDVHRWPSGTKPAQIVQENPEPEIEVPPEEPKPEEPQIEEEFSFSLNFPGTFNPLNLGANCQPTICRLELQTEDKDFPTRDFCFHTPTGLVGQCDSEFAIHLCLPTQLLTCQPKIAPILIDAFLPKPVEPIFVVKLGQDLTFLQLHQVAQYISEFIQNSGIQELPNMFLDLAQNSTLFVENSVEKLQENLKNENDYGLLSFTQDLDKMKLEELLLSLQDQVKFSSRSEMPDFLLAKEQSFLTEIQPGTFKFSEDFMSKFRPNFSWEKLQRQQRTSMEVLTEIMELKKAVFGAKAAFLKMVSSFYKENPENVEKIKGSASSSWPHSPTEKLDPSCTCMSEFKMADPDYQPCTQPIPWCIVHTDAKCPDLSLIKEEVKVDIYWSQLACTDYSQYQGPSFY